MAQEGVRFERAFTPQPVCGPARACLQTGKYATETGCVRNKIGLRVGEKTLAHWLSEAGYEVGYIGKWHLAPTTEERNYTTVPVPPEYRGGYKDYWLVSNKIEFTSHGYGGHVFDGEGRQVDFEGYRVDCLTDFALDYLRSRDGVRPFFLFLSFLEPHQDVGHKRFEGPIGSQERYRNHEVPGDLVGAEGDWRESYPDYLGSCASLDYNLGRLRSELERLGMAENTVVIYTTDHGCHFRTRNAWYKVSCHESSIRIPLIACGPGFRGGKVVKELVSLLDVQATLLAVAGVPRPPTVHGRPLGELVAGGVMDWPQEVFVQISGSHFGRAIRTERWKYSVWVPGEQPGSSRAEARSDIYYEQCLYDLESDPYERNNLVCDAALGRVRAGLAEVLKRRMAEAGESVAEILPAKG
jgi:uncharacterized sulfatase